MSRTFTYEEVMKACLEYFNGDEIAAKSCVTKYLLKDENGNWLEKTPNDYLAYRIANEFKRIEDNYPNPLSLEEIRESLGGLSIEDLEKNPELKKNLGYGPVVPQGSPTFGIGNNSKIISLSNCFVISSPLDSYGSICMKDQEIAHIEKRRGGVGLDLSNLRPRGTNVNNAAITSDGISVFMERFSNTTKEVAQCIAGDQLVLTYNGLKKIEDVSDKDYVWTKIGWVRVEKVLKSKKRVYKLVTKSGYEIKASKDHIFSSHSNDKIVERKLEEISVGENVNLLVGTFFEKESVNLDRTKYIKKNGGEKGMKCSGGNSSRLNEDVIVPNVIDEKLAYIVGYCYGDGSVEYDRFRDPEKISLACAHKYPEIENKIKSYCKDVFNIDVSIRNGDGKLNKVDINSKIICAFLKKNGLLKQKSYEIQFPELILYSSSKIQGAFLAGYFDADGYASGKKKGYCFSGTCFEFLSFVKVILLSNGILSSFHKEDRAKLNWRTLYSVSVVGAYSQKKLLNFFNGYSEKAIKCNHVSKRDNFITPYFPKDLMIKSRDFNGYICADIKMSCNAYSKYADTHDIPEMLVLDEVSSITEGEEVDTYDLVLEKEHMFWCQGFYVHNSGRRGALLESLDCRHPEILTFINVKRDLKKVTGANISVKWHDDFFEALEKNEKYILRFPVDAPIDKAQITKEVSAKEIWDAFVSSAWSTAEPGCFYWDRMINQSITDVYEAEGFRTISTNPCGELGLAAYSSCILMLVNVMKFVKNPYYPDSEFDWQSFEKHTRICTRLIDDLVDLEIEKVKAIISKVESDPEPEEVKAIELNLWKNILHMMEKGRKTGLGVTGLADMLAALGIKYSSENAIEFCDKLFEEIQNIVYKESSILAKERGPFPCWSWDKEKDNYYIKKLPLETQNLIKNNGRRNIASLTLSPAGTTSIMTQTTSGIEPLYMHEMIRRRKMTQDEEKNGVTPDSIDSDGVKWVHTKIFHKGFLDWQQATGDDCFCRSPYSGSQAYELDPKFRVKLQGVIQKHIDSSISSTINLPKTVTKEEVSELYLLGWKHGCKGLTVYRDGSRDGVLISSTNRPSQISDSQAPKRPDILKCEIHTSVIKGTQWVFMVGLLEGRPYEIFGGKSSSMSIPKKFIRGRDSTDAVLRKNGKNSAGISTYDLIVGVSTSTSPETFKDIASIFSPDNGSPTRLVSMLLRHGVPISDICEQIRKMPQEDSMLTFEKGISRVLRKYVADKTTAKGRCPECQSKLIYESGCVKCSQCSWSRCD